MSSLLISALAAAAPSDHWAVLIAGSSGYGNYRHQADVCHAYQVVLRKGIPAENIIVLATDDIANDESNVFPGQMFNKPTPDGTPGTDVYAGCKIDYRGDTVTPANFVRVLTGGKGVAVNAADSTCNPFEKNATKATCTADKSCCCTKHGGFLKMKCEEWTCCNAGSACMGSAGCKAQSSGRVLNSTKDSKVFVNFVDHGGVGIIGFPQTTMHAKDLIGALQTMHDTNMYKELVFYLEACESGSMFQTLPADINIFATTAANAKESSWGTYCPPHDMVNGKSLNSCLGDLYSVNWMEDSDLGISGETLDAQYQSVKKETNKSHVLEFGDLSIASEPITNFQGSNDLLFSSTFSALRSATYTATPGHVDSRDAELHSALAVYLASDSSSDGEKLIQMVGARVSSKGRFVKISQAVANHDVSTRELPFEVDMDCHYAAHKAYIAACGEWGAEDMKHSATLAKLCQYTDGNAQPIAEAIYSVCA